MKKCLLAFLIMGPIVQISLAQSAVKVWETDSVFSGPESVVYDPQREVLYVSNLRKNRVRDIYYADDFISKVSLSGEVIELKWIKDVTEPTGICIYKDQLYIVERFGVVVYDLKADKIENRIRIDNPSFLNDITVGSDATIYVSESDTENIYAIKGEEVNIWYQGKAVSRPNGILFDNGKLLVGANADSTLRAIDVKSKEITVIAQLTKGIIDGIKPIGDDYLVSFFEGNLYRVTKDGKVSEILDTRSANINIADFEYIESKKLLIAPALWQHKLIAFRLNK